MCASRTPPRPLTSRWVCPPLGARLPRNSGQVDVGERVSAKLETANPHLADSKVRGACGTIAVTRVRSRVTSWAP